MKKGSIDIQGLYDLIIDLRTKIDKHRELFVKNEAAVRYALINPLLEALGWDMSNPDDIIPEFPTEAGRPDYVLKKAGKEIAFLGAKALNKPENSLQYISYCLSVGVKCFIATDGASWEIYDIYKIGKIEDRKILFWNIENDPVEDTVRKSLGLAKPIVYVTQNEFGISEVKSSIFASPPDIAKNLPEDLKMNNNKKIRIKIGDEKAIGVDNYVDILYLTADWLIKNGYINKGDIPIKVGDRGTRHLITLTRENPEQDYRILSNGWYLLKKFNAMYIKRLSQELMKKYGKGHKIEIEDKISKIS